MKRSTERSPAPPRVRREAAAPTEAQQEKRVHTALLDAVMSHRLPPGTRLVELPLCAAFGVNRSLLRRVLVRLANEKVVELNHNRGASVAQASAAETRQVFEVRRLLETALLNALEPLPRRALDALRELVDDEQRAHEAGDAPRQIRLSGRFHLQLAQALGNAELVELLRGLVARTSLMIALYEAPGHSACAYDEHRQILAALARGDHAAAAESMAQHLHNCELKLRERPQRPAVDFARLFGGGKAARPARRAA